MTRLPLLKRPRRNRKSAAIRSMIRETNMVSSDLIWPIFLKEGSGIREEIPSMPGVYRWSLDTISRELERLCLIGLKAVILFPVIEDQKKDQFGAYASHPYNIVCRGIQEIKKSFPQLCVISDIALDPFTTSGHDGIFYNNEVLNDESVRVYGDIATLHAEMGADIVAPSDMMDGRVQHIREKMDQMGFVNTGILSYSAKYASYLYGPFRDALSSHPQSGDKRQYQMDPANVREALLECRLDEEEGADMVMIKPAGFYLDVIMKAQECTHLPVVAYQVSGEYSMIMAASLHGWLSKEGAISESLLAIKRAGATAIISYATPWVLEWLARDALPF
ncbi:porphobilinogen synthase [Chlamydia muridarum]|uniref:porphobilinogen synthase n=1 Tax=Chlamydia muridarum TaxID=83560 RepID=UPI00197EA873|nr:porphobilinogen synthase [Chlamydia muridarum]